MGVRQSFLLSGEHSPQPRRGKGAAPSWRGLTAGAGPREPGGQSGKKGARKESSSRRGTWWEWLQWCLQKREVILSSVCEVEVTKTLSL